MAGRPFLANAQSAVFSPFSLPSYVLPFWWSLGLVAALKLFAAAFGTFLLARALGMRFAGSLLSGVVYAFCLFFVVWLSWPLTSVWVWIPWLLLLADLLVRRPGPLPAAGLAVVVAFQYFGGHPESSFHVMFATVAFFALRLFQARRGENAPLRRPIAAFAAALVGGAALAAVAIVPFVELLASSADIDRRAEGDRPTLPARFALALLMPEWWGRPTAGAFDRFYLERGLYVGALPLMLAFAAVAIRPRLERVAIALFGAGCMLVVFAVAPLFQLSLRAPGFAQAQNTRLVILFALCVALLAGFGLDELASRRPAKGRGRVVIGVAAVLACAPLAWLAVGRPSPSSLWSAIELASGFGTPPGDVPLSGQELDLLRLGALLLWLAMAGAAAALLAARTSGRLGASVFAALAVGLVVVDLFRAGVGINPAIDRSEEAVQPSTGALRALQAEPGRFSAFVPEIGAVPLPPDVAMRYELRDARGYDFPIERRYDRLWRTGLPDPDTEDPFLPAFTAAYPSPKSLRVVSLLGASRILQQSADRPVRVRGLRVVYDRPDGRVYANERALPPAAVVGAQDVVPDEDAALRAVTAPGFDGRRTVVTERRLPGIPEGPGASPPGRARIGEYGAERIELTASARRRAVLVLNEVHFPGWKARLDGREVPIERVDYLLRGIALPAGRHRVELRYEPLSWRIGWIVSLLALAALLAAVLVGLRGGRRA